MNEVGLDELLAELEKSIALLADGTAPLDELVAGHQRALELLAKAKELLVQLQSRADETAKLLTQ